MHLTILLQFYVNNVCHSLLQIIEEQDILNKQLVATSTSYSNTLNNLKLNIIHETQ